MSLPIKSKRRRRWLAWLILPLALAGFLIFRQLRPTPVTAQALVRGQAVEAIYATGTVEPIERVVVKARVSEHVESLLVKEGDVVSKGQVLARIETPNRKYALSEGKTQLAKARQQASARSPQLGGMEAEVRSLKAQRELARLERSRAETLAAQDAITQPELEIARAKSEQLSAQVQMAEEQLRSARLELGSTRDQLATQVQSLSDEVDESVVRAPISGIVLSRDVELGEVVALNQSMFTIADTSTLLIELRVDEADIAKVRDGEGASAVALSFYAFGDAAFAGTVNTILPEPDRIRRSYTVKVALDKPIAGLRVGMTAEANIVVQRKDDVLLLPVAALTGAEAWFVKNGRASKRKVSLGIRDMTHVEVTSGAAEGDQAILDAPVRKLKVGQRVSVKMATTP